MRKFNFGKTIYFLAGLGVMLFCVIHAYAAHSAGTVVFAALTANLTQTWKERIEAYLNIFPVFVDALTNKHYEGDIKTSKTLNILSVAEIVSHTYTGADISFDDLATTGITFTADQQLQFSFQFRDTDKIGSAIDLIEIGSKKAGERLARDRDAYVAGLYTGITTNVYGTDAAPIIVGFDNVAGEVLPSVALATLFQKIGEQNGDQSAVNAVLPMWLGSYLIQEMGKKFTSGGDAYSGVGAKIGKLELPFTPAGFKDIYISNDVATTSVVGTSYKVMAGSPDSAITFGAALDLVESGRREANFATYVKGLNVFGAKIPFEKHMALGTFNQGTARTS